MNPIDLKLAEIKKRNRIGIMTHVVVGYPNLKKTVELVKVMSESGADFVELQIPFSDPLADGPTITVACEKSLAQGTRVSDAFTVARKLSGEVTTPLLFMAYYNTVFKYGVSKFCKNAARSGISGLIIPDMSLEEEKREHLSRYAKENGLYLIRVVAPVSTEARLRKNARVAGGFVYCSARQGTTGVRKELSSGLSDYIRTVRRFFDVPLAVGFGISKREQVEQISRHADIAVVGSAIIDVINKSTPELAAENVRRLTRSLRLVG